MANGYWLRQAIGRMLVGGDVEGAHLARDELDALAARLAEAERLLRRTIADLRWAEGMSDSEFSAPLEDPEIINDIDTFLATPETKSGSNE